MSDPLRRSFTEVAPLSEAVGSNSSIGEERSFGSGSRSGAVRRTNSVMGRLLTNLSAPVRVGAALVSGDGDPRPISGEPRRGSGAMLPPSSHPPPRPAVTLTFTPSQSLT